MRSVSVFFLLAHENKRSDENMKDKILYVLVILDSPI